MALALEAMNKTSAREIHTTWAYLDAASVVAASGHFSQMVDESGTEARLDALRLERIRLQYAYVKD